MSVKCEIDVNELVYMHTALLLLAFSGQAGRKASPLTVRSSPLSTPAIQGESKYYMVPT